MSAREAQVLRRAVEIIDERGWCQGEYEDGAGRVCARGAIHVAIGGAPYVDPLSLEKNKFIWEVRCLVVDLIGEGLAVWNDEPGRTVEQVRHALLTAATAAEQDEAVA